MLHELCDEMMTREHWIRRLTQASAGALILLGVTTPSAWAMPTPVGYWKFDEGADNTCAGGANDACNSGSGGSAKDGAESGMAVPATSTSGWTNAGKFGKALSFDGTNDYVDVGTGISSFNPVTVSAWMKRSATAGGVYVRSVVAKDNDSGGRTFAFGIAGTFVG